MKLKIFWLSVLAVCKTSYAASFPQTSCDFTTPHHGGIKASEFNNIIRIKEDTSLKGYFAYDQNVKNETVQINLSCFDCLIDELPPKTQILATLNEWTSK